MRTPRSAVIGIAGFVWLLDVLAKRWALDALADGHAVRLLGSFLQLHLTANSGAAFSMGTGVTWVFTLLALAVVVFIATLSSRLVHPWWVVGLGGLMGGATGNLTDRLTRPPSFGMGHVVDFIALPNFPVFNVADMAIVGSVALMFLASWRNIPMTRESNG